jgi:TetR/AcrR family transcriptional regulator, repressor for uid operon
MTSIPNTIDFSRSSSSSEDGDSAHDQRRRHIMDAAETCFARAGFHKTSMQEICAEAGMSPGALYRYFKSKEAIIGAICLDERARCHVTLQPLDGDGDFTDRFVDMALAYFEQMRRPGAAALMLEVFAEGLRNSDVGKGFLDNERMVRDVIRGFLEDAAAKGEISPDIDLDAALGFMMAVGEGIVMRATIDPALAPERIRSMLAATTDAVFGRAAVSGKNESS